MSSSRERSLRPPYQRRLRLRGAVVVRQNPKFLHGFQKQETELEWFEGVETFVKPVALWRAHRSHRHSVNSFYFDAKLHAMPPWPCERASEQPHQKASGHLRSHSTPSHAVRWRSEGYL